MAEPWPDLTWIFEYYLRSREALSILKAVIQDSPERIGERSRFFAMSQIEVDEAIQEMTEELEQQVVLMLVASAEATLRIDFRDRVGRRLKDPVSRRMRALEQQGKARGRPGVRLEDILKGWQEEVTDRPIKSAIDNRRKLVLYRHWLAHGRHWVEDKSGLNQPDPFAAWSILQRLFNAPPGFSSLPLY